MTLDDLSQEHMLIHTRNARLEQENQRLQQVLLHAEALLAEWMVATPPAPKQHEQEPVAIAVSVHPAVLKTLFLDLPVAVGTKLYAAPPAPDADRLDAQRWRKFVVLYGKGKSLEMWNSQFNHLVDRTAGSQS